MMGTNFMELKPVTREEEFINAYINSSESPAATTREEKFWKNAIDSKLIKVIDLGNDNNIRPWLIEKSGYYCFRTNKNRLYVNEIDGDTISKGHLFSQSKYLILNIFHNYDINREIISATFINDIGVIRAYYKSENNVWLTEFTSFTYFDIKRSFLSISEDNIWKFGGQHYTPQESWQPTNKQYVDECFTKGLDSIVLASPSGTKYKISVNDEGSVVAEAAQESSTQETTG